MAKNPSNFLKIVVYLPQNVVSMLAIEAELRGIDVPTCTRLVLIDHFQPKINVTKEREARAQARERKAQEREAARKAREACAQTRVKNVISNADFTLNYNKTKLIHNATKRKFDYDNTQSFEDNCAGAQRTLNFQKNFTVINIPHEHRRTIKHKPSKREFEYHWEFTFAEACELALKEMKSFYDEIYDEFGGVLPTKQGTVEARLSKLLDT